MDKVLIVEDSKLFGKLLSRRVADDFHAGCVVKTTYQETVALLEEDADQFLLAVLDLNLPDAADGEIVDYVISKGIPAVVVTARLNEETRRQILGKRVLDYIMKGPHTLDLLSSTISRYLRNQDITVLLVDDSNLVRENIRKILETQHFNVVEASDGLAAMTQLKADPSIQLVMTDYHMPKMDGFELTAEIRKSFPMDKLLIIGMSAQGDPLLSAQFLKRGANDFINKPYFEEELVWRINHNVEILHHLNPLRNAAITDSLTGRYNRRYFFQAGGKLFENARRRNLDVCIAMMRFSSIFSRIASKWLRQWALSMLLVMTTNSSPPRRATISDSRKLSSRFFATSTST
jgi:PleD family two-component response regulator